MTYQPSDTFDRFSEKFGGRYFNAVTAQEAEELIDGIQAEVANMIASAIDAGSERDAVMEDEELRAAIKQLVHGWIQVVF